MLEIEIVVAMVGKLWLTNCLFLNIFNTKNTTKSLDMFVLCKNEFYLCINKTKINQ